MRQRLRTVTDFWVDHPVLDLIGTAAAATVQWRWHILRSLQAGDRGTWYQTLAATAGIMLTLGTVAFTLVLTVTPNVRLERVLTVLGGQLHRLIMSSLAALAVATIGFTGLYLLNTSRSTSAGDIVTTALIALALVRFGRLWWILSTVFRALISGIEQSTNSGSDWKRPEVAASDYELPERSG